MNLFFRQKKQQSKLKKEYSFQELQSRIQEMLYEHIEPGVEDTGLTAELRRSREEYRRMISSCIRNCCTGNYGAKETVKELIYEFLLREMLPGREDVTAQIPFDEPEKMTAWQQMEALIFYFDKEEENHGFHRLCRRFRWDRNNTVISEQEIRRAYLELSPVFSREEERKILVQLLYASTVGLGVIDTLNQQKGFIEEIQIGMSGKTEQHYDYRAALSGAEKETNFSRDGVHIMAGGCVFWIKGLSFGTEEELQRVLRNLIKGSQGGELTKKHPMMVVDTIDGRRVSVSRPPMTDTWVGLVRKFDTIKEVSLEKLYQGYPEEKILTGLLRQLVRSGRNIAITGEMASGKTTLFRACLSETKKNMNIRIIEVDSFELNVRDFLPTANTLTMRVTEQTPAEEVLAFARKTTGQVFAVGEINSAVVAAMAMDLSKIASQLIFSAHYITTDHMIADFINAKLCVGGYSEEALAELDVVRCLGFDIHLRAKEGRRYVQYVNEVIPVTNRTGDGGKSYEIRQIYRYEEETGQGIIVNAPGEISYERAKQLLGKEEYMEFVQFFKN